MSELLFHTPWWLPTIILAVGAALFVAGNRRQKSGIRTGGFVVILLGLALIAVSWLVDTDVEKVTNRTHEVVADVEHQDWQKVKALLSPNVRFGYAGFAYNGREELLHGAQATTAQIGLRSVTVTSVEPTAIGPAYETAIRVYAEADKFAGHPVPCDVALKWEKFDNDWLLTEIRLIKIGNVGADEVKQQFR